MDLMFESQHNLGNINGYRIYVDILTGEKLLSIYVANMDITYWSVCSFSKRGGNEVNGVDRYFS